MENYIRTKNIISNVCNQSGLSPVELSGVLNECLSELRYAMLNQAVFESVQLKAQLVKAAEEKKTEDQKTEKKEEK